MLKMTSGIPYKLGIIFASLLALFFLLAFNFILFLSVALHSSVSCQYHVMKPKEDTYIHT